MYGSETIMHREQRVEFDSRQEWSVLRHQQLFKLRFVRLGWTASSSIKAIAYLLSVQLTHPLKSGRVPSVSHRSGTKSYLIRQLTPQSARFRLTAPGYDQYSSLASANPPILPRCNHGE
jgi:hypothetical protein